MVGSYKAAPTQGLFTSGCVQACNGLCSRVARIAPQCGEVMDAWIVRRLAYTPRVIPDLMTLLEKMKFEHPWLQDEFVAESRDFGRSESARKHHCVPQMYLRRWAVDEKVQPVQVDSRQTHRPQSPKEVAYQTTSTASPQSTAPWIYR